MARVLLVEDDEGMLLITEQWLLDEQYEVDTASTGVSCWERLKGNSYDLVLLDWDLPDWNGIDILKKFRKEGGTTPIIMLTGRTNVDYKAEGLDAGANDYLTKPFHVKELLARVRAAIRQGQQAKPAQQQPLPGNNQALIDKFDLRGTSLPAKYELHEVLGEGGVGTVFKARHPHLDKLVAIKMLRKSEMDKEMFARFEQEARVISQLEHPNIATIYDFDVTENNQPYMVMEFINGKAVDILLSEAGSLPLEQALNLSIQVCEGMAHAHARGVLHRDLKPSNFMLKQMEGNAPLLKVLDFGCSKLRQMGSRKGPAITQTGGILGSPYYMSPEQVKSEQTDERSDIYSLGCVIFQLVTGAPPLMADDCVAVMVKHVNDYAPSFRSARPDLRIPDEMEFLVAKCLEKDPGKRYQSMVELKTVLEQIRMRLQPGRNDSWWQKLNPGSWRKP
jgi:serine/threonine protein kinase/CheY-like chemotaxis protein